MSNTTKTVYGKNFHIKGTPDPVVIEAPDSTLALAGTVNIVAGGNGSPAGLTIEGVDIIDYIGLPITTTISLSLTEDMTFVIADHPATDTEIVLGLPEISTLSGTKRYLIEFKGDLRFADDTVNGRQVILKPHAKTGDATKGDFFDNIGSVVNGVWFGNQNFYQKGTIEIYSVVGGYTGGTGNGWVISTSHLHQYSYIKAPVRLTSVADFGSFPNGFTTGTTIDGIVLKKHDRILLKDQTSQEENGVYDVQDSSAARSPDFKDGTYVGGYEFSVSEGTNVNDKYYCTNKPGSSKVGSVNLTFAKISHDAGGLTTEVQFNNAGLADGDSGMTYDGTNLSIAAPTSNLHAATKLYVDSASTSPGGSTTQFQYNNAGAFAGTSALTFDGTSIQINGTLSMPNKGAVTQLTSMTTGVTSNSTSGKITTVSLNLASHAKASFTVTSFAVSATAFVLANVLDYGGAGSINVTVDNLASGSFDLIITNCSGTTLDAVAIIGYIIIL